jgi:hypothetical protein
VLPSQFDALPIGAIVSHVNTEMSCYYRKVVDGSGWQTCGIFPPYEPKGTRATAVIRIDSAKDLTLRHMPEQKLLSLAEFKALPIGSVVVYTGNEGTCRYKKEADSERNGLWRIKAVPTAWETRTGKTVDKPRYLNRDGGTINGSPNLAQDEDVDDCYPHPHAPKGMTNLYLCPDSVQPKDRIVAAGGWCAISVVTPKLKKSVQIQQLQKQVEELQEARAAGLKRIKELELALTRSDENLVASRRGRTDERERAQTNRARLEKLVGDLRNQLARSESRVDGLDKARVKAESQVRDLRHAANTWATTLAQLQQED